MHLKKFPNRHPPWGPAGLLTEAARNPLKTPIRIASALALAGLAMRGRAQEQPATEHLAPKEKIGSVVSLDVYTHKDNLDLVVATETEIGPTLTHRRSKDGGR